MMKGKFGLLALAVVAGLLAAACTASANGQEVGENQTASTGPGASLPASNLSSTEGSTSGTGAASLQTSGTSQNGGISVTGSGSITVSPDVAILVLGVMAKRETVTQARDDAARAMDSLVQVLKDNGVAEADIKTQSLSIYPVYTYLRDSQELDGFQVTNIVRVKIRDLDKVGTIIDQAVDAGGDLTRVQSIGFTVDDSTPFMAELREKAVQDAVAKAEQLAALTGVTLGPPISIVEGGGVFPVFDVGVRAFAEAAPAPVTSISPGEMELNLNVGIVFAIQ